MPLPTVAFYFFCVAESQCVFFMRIDNLPS